MQGQPDSHQPDTSSNGFGVDNAENVQGISADQLQHILQSLREEDRALQRQQHNMQLEHNLLLWLQQTVAAIPACDGCAYRFL